MSEEKSDFETSGEGRWEDKLSLVPASPGVYIFRDSQGKALYVGKAKNLRARVRAYARESGDTRYHVSFLRPRIHELEFVVTDNEKEALILENNLIKKYRPRYNIRLRDDKTFFHLKLTVSEEYPRLLLVRRPDKKSKDLLFGPFSSSRAVKETITTLQEIFPLRRCKGRFRTRERPCLNFQIGKCLGPCTGKVSKEEYQELVEEVIKFMKGRKPELIKDLERKMREAAEREEFERAALYRDRIRAVERTLEAQKVDSVKPVDRDVIGFYREGNKVVVRRLGFRGGALLLSESDFFNRVTLSDEEVLASYLAQLYAGGEPLPEEVLLPFPPADMEFLEQTLAEAGSGRVAFRVPRRGEARRLVELAEKNAREDFRKEAAGEEEEADMAEELMAALKLRKAPRAVECVDISILAGEAAVGSIVRFRQGKPEKAGYRRYRIKTVEGVDDYGMMREVLIRRFQHALKGEEPLPDLLVVDGGKGQLNVALAAARDLGITDLEIISLAKERNARGKKAAPDKREKVYLPGVKDPVMLKPGSPALLFLQRVRDEAHRFAIAYHKKVRANKLKRSKLEEIPGIGPKKAKKLLAHFKSMEAVRNAAPEEIASLPGLSKKDAERIKQFLSPSLKP